MEKVLGRLTALAAVFAIFGIWGIDGLFISLFLVMAFHIAYRLRQGHWMDD